MGKWYELAVRYVVANERNADALVTNQLAQAKLADSHRGRNALLAEIDMRHVVATEGRGNQIDDIGRFMGGTLEHLARIEAKLALPPNSVATPEEPK